MAKQSKTTAAALPAEDYAPEVVETTESAPEYDGTEYVTPESVAAMGVAGDELPMPQFDEVQEIRGSESTDGGFFALEKGNVLLGRFVRMAEVPSSFGEDRQVNIPGVGPSTVKTQTVYVFRGTAEILTESGLQRMSGLYKVSQTERLKMALDRYVKDPTKIAKITVLGRERDRIRKTDQQKRSGAVLYDVREVQARRPVTP